MNKMPYNHFLFSISSPTITPTKTHWAVARHLGLTTT